MDHIGTFAPGSTVPYWFNTQGVDQAPVALSGGTLRVYKQGSDVQDDSGITLTADYDSVTGLNAVVVDTSSDTTFYAGPAEFAAVLTAGTAGGVSVTGARVFSFRLSDSGAAAGTSLLLLHHGAHQSTWQRGF